MTDSEAERQFAEAFDGRYDIKHFEAIGIGDDVVSVPGNRMV